MKAFPVIEKFVCKYEPPIRKKNSCFSFALSTHSEHVCDKICGSFPTPSNFQTLCWILTGCPTILFISNTIYLEIVSDPIIKG